MPDKIKKWCQKSTSLVDRITGAHMKKLFSEFASA